ncbi:MAG: NosD domain-containing protein, partial [Candidatus Heimdallarchaeaceae archaeon]
NQYISNVNIGIEILECNNISIVENYFYEINMFDCYILLSTNVNFSSNICEEGSTGVFVRLNENCTINSNVFLEIDKGISFSDTMSTTVIDNSFTNSSFSFDLLSQDAFSELIFHNNTINNKPFGFFKDETNLIISNSDFSQILLSNCSNVEITNQTLSYVWNTIYITDCAEINVHDSNFNKNHDVLLFLRSSLIEIKNCEFNYNSVPIILIDSYVIEISQNNFFNNENTAIIGFFSSSLQIRLNLIHNSSTGICFFATDYGTITFNTIQYCRDYGIELLYDSAYNKIYSNNFIENYLTHSGSQAYDEGYHNDWYDGVNYKGNYWSNWNPLENYYRIDGSAESKDIYPNSMLMGEYSSALLYSIFLPIVLIIINRRKKKKNRR